MAIKRVSTKKNKDGLLKYEVRITYNDNTGKERRLTRRIWGIDNAKDLEQHLEDEYKNKGKLNTPKMTVQELFDEYIATKQRASRESSLNKVRSDFRLYIQPTMADVRIDKLTASSLQKWKTSIEAKDLSLVTRQHAYSTFCAMLHYAVKMEYIPKNYLSTLGTFRDAMYTKTEMKFYTAEQFRVYIATVKQQAEEHYKKHNNLSEWEYYVFFNIAFFTGLRKGEIHGLRWSDIDGALLSVRRSVAQKMKGEDRETPPKTKSSIRTLQMPASLIEVLDEHKKRKQRLEDFSEDDKICGNGRSLRDGTIDKKNRGYAELAGLDRIRIHDFRHSHVSVLANAGINIQEIARRLGHTKIEETLNTYSHMYAREEEKAVDVLNKIA